MDEMEFDRTRKAIRAENLDLNSRRDMLKRLKDAGGEVKQERALGGEPEAGGRGGAGRGTSDRKMPSDLAREKLRLEGEARAKARRSLQEAEREATSFFARFSIKLKCRMAGITPFGRAVVYPRFMSRLNLDAKRAVMECNILARDLFATNAEIGRALIKELDKRQPLYVELIERASELYNPTEIGNLTSPYNAAPSTPVPVDAIRAPLFSFLRKLYYLKAFQETYLTAVDTAIGLQQKLEKKQSGLYASKRKKIVSDWKTLMNEIYPQLVLLAQRAEMKQAEPNTRLFDEMLSIVDENRLGRRQPGDSVGKLAEPQEEAKAEETGTEEEQPTKEEAVEEEVPKDVQIGMQLMRALDLTDLRKKHDVRGDLKEIADNDKVLISYLLLKEFESEYSFVLTTQKIQLNPIYKQGKKLDYHQRLADIFEQIRAPIDQFKQYAHQTLEYNRVVGEGAAHVQNYVEHAKRVQLLEGRRGGSGRETRMAIKTFMERVHTTLSDLMDDVRENRNQIVLNASDPIKFDAQIEGKRRLHGRTVAESLQEAYSYSLALAGRIEDGDLFGGVIEMSDEDFQRAFGMEPLPQGDLPDATH